MNSRWAILALALVALCHPLPLEASSTGAGSEWLTLPPTEAPGQAGSSVGAPPPASPTPGQTGAPLAPSGGQNTGGFAAPGSLPRFSTPGKSKEWLTISGFLTWTGRSSSISGGSAGQQAFLGQQYQYSQNFETNAGLNITGPILPGLQRFVVNATINQSRYAAPDQSRYELEYRGNGLNIALGHINAALPGNSFVPYNRSLVGLKIDGKIGAFGLTTLFSEERAQVATDNFPGTNSAGPYSLRYSPILDGTEQVRVDGIRKKLGDDYTIDYNTGMLWFQPTIIIPATSTIEVSYEYAGLGQNPGMLVGFRGDLPFLKGGKLGATFIKHISDANGSGSTPQRTDLFIGSNTVMTLNLRFRPVKRIVSITVDGQAQVEGVDFDVQSLSAGVVVFHKVVPAPPGGDTADANVVVIYEVDNTATAGSVGDRSILGLDGAFNFGKVGTIGMEWARSAGNTTQNGSALSLRGNANLGNLVLGLSFRDVGNQFTPIDSVGFMQGGRSLDANAEYKPIDHIRVTAQMNSSNRPGYLPTSYYGSTTTTSTNSDMKALQTSFGVLLNFPDLPELELTHQQFSTTGGSLNSGSAMSGLRLHYALGSLVDFTANLDSSNNSDHTVGTSMTSLTQRYGVRYTPAANFSVQADYSNSGLNSRTPTTTSGTTTTTTQLVSSSNRAVTANLAASYSPFTIKGRNPITLTANFRTSDSGTGGYGGYNPYGGLTTFSGLGNSYYSGGYINTSNIGYGDQYTGNYTSFNYNNYNSGGSVWNSGTTNTGTSGSYTGGTVLPTPRLRDATTTDATGTTSGTTTTTTTTSTRIRSTSQSVGLQINPVDKLSFNLNWGHDLQEGQFTGSNSVSTNLGFGFMYSPFKLLSLNGQISKQDYTFMGAGGNSGSTIAFMGAQFGPVSRLTFRMNFQTMTSNTGIAAYSTPVASYPTGSYSSGTYTGGSYTSYPTTTGYTGMTNALMAAALSRDTTTTNTTGTTTTVAASNYTTRMNTLTGRIEYQLSQNRRLFTELQLSKVGGGGTLAAGSNPEDSNRLSAALGIEFSLNKYLSWTMDFQHINYADRNNPSRNYKGNLLSGEMRAHF